MKKFILSLTVLASCVLMTSCSKKLAEEIKKDCSCGHTECACPVGCSCACNG